MKRISIITVCAILFTILAACEIKKQDVEEFDFYDKRLRIIIDILEEECGDTEPNLMTNNIDVVFYSDGLIRSISGYIYGFDENYNLTSGYAIDYSVTGKMFVHKQKFNGNTEIKYNLSNDFEQLCALVDVIDLESVVEDLNDELCGLLSKGIRDFGYDATNLTEITQSGDLKQCDSFGREEPFVGQSFSVYVSGESYEKYRRFIYMNDSSFNLSGEVK